MQNKIVVRHLQNNDSDKAQWLKRDSRTFVERMNNKIANNECYFVLLNNKVRGLMSYDIVDEIPIVYKLFIDAIARRKGCARALIKQFEEDMQNKGFERVGVSHHGNDLYERVYRKLGYIEGKEECLYKSLL